MRKQRCEEVEMCVQCKPVVSLQLKQEEDEVSFVCTHWLICTQLHTSTVSEAMKGRDIGRRWSLSWSTNLLSFADHKFRYSVHKLLAFILIASQSNGAPILSLYNSCNIITPLSPRLSVDLFHRLSDVTVKTCTVLLCRHLVLDSVKPLASFFLYVSSTFLITDLSSFVDLCCSFLKHPPSVSFRQFEGPKFTPTYNNI
jgi:hypothetical protein